MYVNAWSRRLRPALRICGLFAALGLAAAVPAHADDPDYLSVGGGYFDILDDNGAGEIRLEYRSAAKLWVFKPFVGAMGTTDQAFYLYGGLLTDIYLGRRFVLTPSLAAGYFEEGDGKDLGSEIEFRSSVEVAYRFDNRARLGVAFYHLSNASISDTNPGTEVLSVVFSWPLGNGN